MATPEVDRLHAIEPWDPRVNDATTEAVKTVGDKLHLVADLTARAAADLGMNGATAEAAAAELDALTKRVRASADGMHAIAKSRTTVTTAGRHAQDTSKQLQKQLKAIESNFSRVTKLSSGVPMGGALLAQATAERDAKHAELEAHASKELTTLDHVAVTEGKGLPFQPTEPSSAGRHGTGDSGSASGTGGGGRDPRSPQGSASGGAEGPASSEPGQNMGLPRSATEWRATGLGDAVGSPGHAGQAPALLGSPDAGSGVGLQGSHYAPQQPSGDHSGAVFGGPARPSGLSSPAVYDPLAAAAATTAGGVIGYKAFQAVRAAKAAPAAPVSSPRAGVRSGAAVRAAPGLRPSGIARGATTAPRATTASASSGSSAPARGGATGAARPAPASPSARSTGVLRGTTTAPRATTTSASSGSSASRSPLMRGGATTAPRSRTNDPAVSRTDGKGSYTRTSSTGSAGSAAKSPAAGRTAGRAEGRTPGSPQAGARASGGGASARSGQTRTGHGGPAGRPLDGLTGKHTRHDKNRTSSRERRREDKNTSAYEPDRRITFLPAGPHPTNNQ